MGAEFKETHISIREFAGQFGVSVRTAYRWASQRTIPTVKIGHVRRVLVAGLEDLDRAAYGASTPTPAASSTPIASQVPIASAPITTEITR